MPEERRSETLLGRKGETQRAAGTSRYRMSSSTYSDVLGRHSGHTRPHLEANTASSVPLRDAVTGMMMFADDIIVCRDTERKQVLRTNSAEQ